ncbi:spermidine synthase [Anaerotaenia torta]|uniref:polyamine aminopropyltransferase n=1 Tax=Anaerotaenia torta TaxID=433293 RepID=UPI003D2226DE
MELWYSEQHTEHVKLSLKVRKQLYGGQSDFQHIAVLDTVEFGRALTLDGCLMVTEKDEFIYHDMIVHVPMATNPEIKKVLVIGAGDGGTIRELVRYSGIERIDMVEIDEMVVRVCKQYLPQTACCLEEPRVHIYYEDGLKFVRRQVNEYDLILVDSTDPFGPGEGLFTKEFYGNCYQALKDQGILVNQHESTYYASYVDAMKRAHQRIKETFPIARVYQAHIPTYPSGHWLFGYASKHYDPIRDLKAGAWNELGIKTKYYNTELHTGCFALPNYVKEQLNEYQ